MFSSPPKGVNDGGKSSSPFSMLRQPVTPTPSVDPPTPFGRRSSSHITPTMKSRVRTNSKVDVTTTSISNNNNSNGGKRALYLAEDPVDNVERLVQLLSVDSLMAGQERVESELKSAVRGGSQSAKTVGGGERGELGRKKSNLAPLQRNSSASLAKTKPSNQDAVVDEKQRLDAFLSRFHESYEFPDSHFHALFVELLSQRVADPQWDTGKYSNSHRIRVLRVVRVLSRDQAILGLLAAEERSVRVLEAMFASRVDEHVARNTESGSSRILIELSSIFKRFALDERHQPLLMARTAILEGMVRLVADRAVDLQTTVLVSLLAMSSHSKFFECTADYASILMESCVFILQSPEVRQLAADFIDVLSQDKAFQAQFVVNGGINMLVRILSKNQHNLPYPFLSSCVRILSHYAVEPESAIQMVSAKVIPLLLGSLDPTVWEIPDADTDDDHSSSSSPTAVSRRQERKQAHEQDPAGFNAFQTAVCACLSQLALTDEYAVIIHKRGSGLFSLAWTAFDGMQARIASGGQRATSSESLTHLVTREVSTSTRSQKTPSPPSMGRRDSESSSFSGRKRKQLHALRAMRFLYGVERNRSAFKRFFPAALFAVFIDVGHYVSSLNAYKPVLEAYNQCSVEQYMSMAVGLETLKASVENAAATARVISDYVVQDTLGRGAFGTVYQVTKRPRDGAGGDGKSNGKSFTNSSSSSSSSSSSNSSNSSSSSSMSSSAAEGEQKLYALKELRLDAPEFAMQYDDDSTKKRVSALCEEIKIISKLEHPNIVKYYDSFVDHKEHGLYIVMELVNGSSLQDRLTSLRDKGKRMSENQIWNVVTQLVLALTYMHTEQRVVHRDLTAANVLMSVRNGCIKISDFGLAASKNNSSLMKSAVGTISYACPEIVKCEPYTDKADIWSLGCIVYYMCTLKPAFGGTNPLAVAQQVVHAQYTPIPESSGYSALLVNLVTKLLTPEVDARPSITEVGGLIAPILVSQLNQQRVANQSLFNEVHFEQGMRRKDRDEFRLQRQAWKQSSNRNLRAKSASKTGFVSSHTAPLHGITPESPSNAPPAPLQSPLHNRHKRTHSNHLLQASPSPLHNRHKRTASSSQLLQVSELLLLQASPSNKDRGGSLSIPLTLSRSRTNPHTVPLLPTRVNPSKLNAIRDPIDEMLEMAHRLVWIDQLPPSVKPDPKRSMVKHYKHQLFGSSDMKSGDVLRNMVLKEELYNLTTRSVELIEVDFPVARAMSHSFAQGKPSSDSDKFGLPSLKGSSSGNSAYRPQLSGSVTYEQMAGMVEQLCKVYGHPSE